MDTGRLNTRLARKADNSTRLTYGRGKTSDFCLTEFGQLNVLSLRVRCCNDAAGNQDDFRNREMLCFHPLCSIHFSTPIIKTVIAESLARNEGIHPATYVPHQLSASPLHIHRTVANGPLLGDSRGFVIRGFLYCAAANASAWNTPSTPSRYKTCFL